MAFLRSRHLLPAKIFEKRPDAFPRPLAPSQPNMRAKIGKNTDKGERIVAFRPDFLEPLRQKLLKPWCWGLLVGVQPRRLRGHRCRLPTAQSGAKPRLRNCRRKRFWRGNANGIAMYRPLWSASFASYAEHGFIVTKHAKPLQQGFS